MTRAPAEPASSGPARRRAVRKPPETRQQNPFSADKRQALNKKQKGRTADAASSGHPTSDLIACILHPDFYIRILHPAYSRSQAVTLRRVFRGFAGGLSLLGLRSGSTASSGLPLPSTHAFVMVILAMV